MNDIIQYDKFFSFNVVERITSKINEPRWRHGHGSHVDENNNSLGIPFWRMDLLDDTYFSDYLLNIIREKTQQDYDLYDVYANGHTFGTQGEFHVDWYEPNGRTLLYYANSNWRPEWGGKTIFLLDKEELFYQNPIPNSAVLFPGNTPRAGRLYFFLTKKNYFIKILYQTLLFFSPVTHPTWQREHLDYFLD
ncbi:DNA endonuclease V [Synechococcus phage ACG-2014j]|uniref:Prolyl 4-hydroxylase alpha subunit Fe(2+) 2OG dioxygenase domain-containing protein n=1 Tax=Synechococcus phage ACG-2014j TaxID=1493514 RepID=A0A0E3FJV5_9CAUD|nr:DNA endonuclease V [Synechococcus phage ACG-2014j]AIX28380.1 hypothetical protein Syn7803US23_36 [Synechococcus phage ACG-2014j]